MQNQFRENVGLGKFAEALEIAETVREVVSKHFGEEHPVFASSLNNLGYVYKVPFKISFQSPISEYTLL